MIAILEQLEQPGADPTFPHDQAYASWYLQSTSGELMLIHMKPTTKYAARDRVTGQYAHSADPDRMCGCGHPLAVHTEGGRSCINEDIYCDSRATGEACDCAKFRPVRNPLKKAR